MPSCCSIVGSILTAVVQLVGKLGPLTALQQKVATLNTPLLLKHDTKNSNSVLLSMTCCGVKCISYQYMLYEVVFLSVILLTKCEVLLNVFTVNLTVKVI